MSLEHSADYIDWAAFEFSACISARADELAQRGGEFTHLQDYLMVWLEEGDAIECSGGRFETYLRIVVRIIDQWQRDPTVDGAIQQPVVGILDPERTTAWAVSPEYFAYVAIRKQLGQPPSSS